ncbi:hypothetical protein BDR26DRAFT_428967 [Obelidium mucronatum]|nr:hypothetical protein BDR26DRAFT_428967 [Obelidium mucronatum]
MICNDANLALLPVELLHHILAFLPTSTLAALLLTCRNISLVASSILTDRSHYINTLEDLRSFTHDIPFHLVPWAVSSPVPNTNLNRPFHHQLKRKQIGPVFYRAGTMLLFARTFHTSYSRGEVASRHGIRNGTRLVHVCLLRGTFFRCSDALFCDGSR